MSEQPKRMEKEQQQVKNTDNQQQSGGQPQGSDQNQDQQSGQSSGKNYQQQSKQKSPQGPEQNGEQQQDQAASGLPEWVSFGIGLAIVLTLVVLLTVFHYSGKEGPPNPQVNAQMERVTTAGNRFYLPFQVTNNGGSTAEDVNVEVQLQPEQGQPENLTFNVRFLSPGESVYVTLIFQNDPTKGKLSQVISYKYP